MQDPGMVFSELGLKAGDVFLDIGCGVGDYAIHAARLVGNVGHVYALDKVPFLIRELQARAVAEDVTNLTAGVADAAHSLPIHDDSVDVCLVSTVLHIPDVTANSDRLFSEIRRVLKTDGHVAIIECSKKDLSFGPPEKMRLTPDEVETMATRCGFHKLREVDLGFNYMITLT